MGARAVPRVPLEPPARSPAPPRGLRARRHRPQGGRRRQRGDQVLDRAHARQGRRRPALPAGQGGGALGARGARGQEQVPEPRATGRGGSAAPAGGERHPARLVPHADARRRRARLLRAATLGRQAVARHRQHDARSRSRSSPRCAAGPLHVGTRAPETGSRSRRISARGASSTGRWASSRSAYADQNDRDYQAMVAAVGGGATTAPPA